MKLAPERTPRVAVRLHPVDHPAFEQELDIVVGGAAKYICHLMIPKVETVAQIQRTVHLVDLLVAKSGRTSAMPLHVLIESPKAVHQAYEIAEHDRVQSLSFGLMDFVSAHGGAIPVSAMGLAFGDELDQFSHPLVVRAKLEIVSACHAHGKVPSHCVVAEIDDATRVLKAANRACRAFGYTRMWSIHPGQIKPILEAFAPSEHEIDQAVEVMLAAEQANWAPISLGGKLNDRASYRYFWQVLERAQRTGRQMPAEARRFFQ
jgi:citrate lyase subunit beta/citryl-CoA lyase